MKELFTFCLLSLLTFSSYAQKQLKPEPELYTHQIELGIGDAFLLRFLVDFSPLFESLRTATKDQLQTPDESYIFMIGELSNSVLIHFNYSKKVSKRLNLGAGLAYYGVSSDNSFIKTPDYEFQRLHQSLRIFLLHTQFQFDYLHKAKWRIYGRSGIGILAAFVNDKQLNNHKNYLHSKADFSFQINPIGFEIGKRIGFYGELGVGTQAFCKWVFLVNYKAISRKSLKLHSKTKKIN